MIHPETPEEWAEYEIIVQRFEDSGMTRSDAQGSADIEWDRTHSEFVINIDFCPECEKRKDSQYPLDSRFIMGNMVDGCCDRCTYVTPIEGM